MEFLVELNSHYSNVFPLESSDQRITLLKKFEDTIQYFSSYPRDFSKIAHMILEYYEEIISNFSDCSDAGEVSEMEKDLGRTKNELVISCRNLFSRVLSCSHLNHQESFQMFQNFEKNLDQENYEKSIWTMKEKSYDQAKARWEKLSYFEAKLFEKSGTRNKNEFSTLQPKILAYLSQIYRIFPAEMHTKLTVAVWERVITSFSMYREVSLWKNYFESILIYDSNSTFVQSIVSRASRTVYSEVYFWTYKLFQLEILSGESNQVKEQYVLARKAVILNTSKQGLVDLDIHYLHYLIRLFRKGQINADSVKEFWAERINELSKDPDNYVPYHRLSIKYASWIFSDLSEVEVARNIYQNLTDSNMKYHAEVWMSYLEFELNNCFKQGSNVSSTYSKISEIYEKCFESGGDMCKLMDWPESVLDSWSSFDNRFLTRASHLVSQELKILKLKRIVEKRRKREMRNMVVTQPEPSSLSGQKRELAFEQDKSVSDYSFKKPKVELKSEMGKTKNGVDSSEKKIKFTAFISNLLPMVTKENLEAHFKQCGEIKDIRIVQDWTPGRGKTFAYIDFSHQESIDEALKLNRSLLKIENGRSKPVYVDKYRDRKKIKRKNNI